MKTYGLSRNVSAPVTPVRFLLTDVLQNNKTMTYPFSSLEIWNFTMAYFFLTSILHTYSDRFTQGQKLDGVKVLKTFILGTVNFGSLAWGLIYYASLYGHNHTEPWRMALGKLLLAGVLAEVWFYMSHRALHWAPLYGSIHKIHHEWVYPVSYAVYYCHPVENILSNLATVLIPMYITDMSHNLSLLWIGIAMFQSISAHAGPINFCGMKFTSAHDLHHRYFNCQYGVGSVMDWLFGTRLQDTI
jgi:sterol desaturase/sphingolipid hydroxylase (fatty acid hydroxylase superfamily)